jgi:hypothetical protein
LLEFVSLLSKMAVGFSPYLRTEGKGTVRNHEELNTMIDVVDSFLHRSFALGDDVAKLKSAVPPKAPRVP